MALEKWKVKNFLRGRSEEIIIRFNIDDFVKLPCHCNYDPALCSEDISEVMLLSKIEIRDSDGSWSPYPSATWIDGVEDDEQLVSRALIKKTGKNGFYVMTSSQGVPDGKLLLAAKEAGIYTETIYG